MKFRSFNFFPGGRDAAGPSIFSNYKGFYMSTELTTNTTPGGLNLSNLGDAFEFAKMLQRTAFAPKGWKAEDILAALQYGAEVGLSPLTSLQSIAVVSGKPSLYGDAAIGLVRASGLCEYIKETVEGEGEKMVARCETKRKGEPEPHVTTFSVPEAKTAKLWGKVGPWTDYPARMLGMRARGFALRNCYADVLRGLITVEEARDYPAQTELQQPRQPVEVRYKADETPEPEVEPEDKVSKSIKAVRACDDLKKLATFTKITNDRVASKEWAEFDADEVRDAIAERENQLLALEAIEAGAM